MSSSTPTAGAEQAGLRPGFVSRGPREEADPANALPELAPAGGLGQPGLDAELAPAGGALGEDGGGDADAASGELDLLTESGWGERDEPLPRRERRFELGLSLAVLAGCAVLAVLGDAPFEFNLALLIALLAYALAFRVRYPFGVGTLVPTQPFLVVLFALAPPAEVPLLVCAALAIATLIDAALGRTRLDRLSLVGGDAVHAIGPAVVLIVAGVTQLTGAPWYLLLAALAAQFGCDMVSSTLREWVALGVRPRLQARVLGHTFSLDLCLAPLGLLAAHAVTTSELAVLALVPLVAVVAYTARDRSRSFARAAARLRAIDHERARLRLAIRRVGETLGSNLDLDSLLAVLTRTTVEALDAQTGRASGYSGAGRKLLAHASVGEEGEDSELLARAERAALGACDLVTSSERGRFALAGRIEYRGELIGVLTVARDGAFEPADRELLAYLCAQAGIAAKNIHRHESLRHQALTDELTQLANHRRFQEVLATTTARWARGGTKAALVFFDLDNFKALNDSRGHQFGDEVLRAVGDCLAEHCRQEDEPARYGGEEFAIVLPGVDERQAVELAERMRLAVMRLELTTPDGDPIRVSVSAGVAALGITNSSTQALVKAADGALYAAKRRGRNNVAASSRVVEVPEARPRKVMAEGLPLAIERDELRLEFQPVVRLSSGHTVAIEALVRWQHPGRGRIAPGDFIAAAEERGWIAAIGRWVLEEATRSAVGWLERWPGLMLAVNVSPVQLAQDGFSRDLEAILGQSGFPPELLILELTESSPVKDSAATIERLAAARALGVRVALDDFGMRHAGLHNLLTLPVDLVKIPQPFTTRLDGPIPRDRTVCESMVELLRGSGLAIVAEGVEREEQRVRLAGLGVDLAQGYLFSAPLAPDTLDEWLARTPPLLGDELAARRAAGS